MELAPAVGRRLNPAPPPRTQPKADPSPCPCGAPTARKSPRFREQLQAAAPEAEEGGRVLSLGGPDPSHSPWSVGPPRSGRLAPPSGPGQRLLGPRLGPPAPPRRRRRRTTQLFLGVSLPGGSHGQGKSPGVPESHRGGALVGGAGQVLRTCSWSPLCSGFWRRGSECGHTPCCLGREPWRR